MIRRGGTYGPHLPEDAPDDGVERGVAAFVGCASLARQFEFTMNVWMNDPEFHELGNERDPIFGTHDGTFDFTIPEAADQAKDQGPSRFHHGAGRSLFLPAGHRRRCASLRPVERMHADDRDAPHLQPGSRPAQIHAGQAARKHLRRLELSGRSQSRRGGDGQPLLDHDRSAPRRMAGNTKRRPTAIR